LDSSIPEIFPLSIRIRCGPQEGSSLTPSSRAWAISSGMRAWPLGLKAGHGDILGAESQRGERHIDRHVAAADHKDFFTWACRWPRWMSMRKSKPGIRSPSCSILSVFWRQPPVARNTLSYSFLRCFSVTFAPPMLTFSSNLIPVRSTLGFASSQLPWGDGRREYNT